MSEHTHDDAMRDEIRQPYHTVRFVTADDQWNEYPIASLRAYIERIEAERDEAHRTAGKAIEDVRLERGVYVKLTKILKEKVRTLEAERDEWKRVAEWLVDDLEAYGVDSARYRAAIEAVRSSHE